MKISGNTIVISGSGGAILGGSFGGPVGAIIGALAGATLGLISSDGVHPKPRRYTVEKNGRVVTFDLAKDKSGVIKATLAKEEGCLQ